MRNLLVVCVIAVAPLAARAGKTFTGTADGAWDCAKEPSVHILRGEGTYAFKGACKTIAVDGGNNKLTIEAVDTLRIVGGGNAVEVGALGAASIMGSGNKLTWRTAQTGDQPRISTVGANNQVARVK
jgi:hypothetical protein